MNENIVTLSGTVTTAPVLSTARLAEFVVVGAGGVVTDDVRVGASVTVEGAQGWVIPGRSWRREPSRTIVQAYAVSAHALALAA
jgi:serine acetyltransferase